MIPRHRLRPLALLATVALIGAGCSGGSDDDASTTASGSGAGPSRGTATASPQDKGVQFAECMRESGVAAFPDPTGASDQELMDAIEALDTTSAAFEKAIAACKDLRPAGLLGGKASGEQQDARLAFAQCMRDNGIKDFPDPVDDGPLIDTNRIPSAAGRGALEIPGFKEAQDACQDVAAKALGDR